MKKLLSIVAGLALCMGVCVSPAMAKTVIDQPAYDETITVEVEPAWTEVIEHPASQHLEYNYEEFEWNEVVVIVDEAGWEETIVHPAETMMLPVMVQDGYWTKYHVMVQPEWVEHIYHPATYHTEWYYAGDNANSYVDDCGTYEVPDDYYIDYADGSREYISFEEWRQYYDCEKDWPEDAVVIDRVRWLYPRAVIDEEAWDEYIFHDAEYYDQDVYIEPVFEDQEVVVAEEWSEVRIHEAVTHTEIIPHSDWREVGKFVDDPAWTETIEHPAITEEQVIHHDAITHEEPDAVVEPVNDNIDKPVNPTAPEVGPYLGSKEKVSDPEPAIQQEEANVEQTEEQAVPTDSIETVEIVTHESYLPKTADNIEFGNLTVFVSMLALIGVFSLLLTYPKED